MSISRAMLQAAAGAAGGEALAIEDVFSTYIYTGTGAALTITNGIDLAGEGGLVWLKRRDSTNDHGLFDTERGATKWIQSNGVDAETTTATSLTSFNSDGFTLGSYFVFNNDPTRTYASWTFRKAPRFFDVVTYTGTGSARTVSHNLGVVPGCIMVKRTDSTGDWIVYHRSNTANPETDYLELNDTVATTDDNTMWNDTAPTDSVFTVGTNNDVNASTATYVAYLFAHDPLGPSGDGSDGLIACGSFNYDDGEVILGWEPQFVLVKPAASGTTGNWSIGDTLRGLASQYGVSGAWRVLVANTSGAESDNYGVTPTARGFTVHPDFLYNGYIYIAIRRGPMRQPTVGTEVFSPVAWTGDNVTGRNIATGFPVDLTVEQIRTGFAQANLWFDRVRGYSSTAAGNSYHLRSPVTDAEFALANYNYVPTMDGFNFGVTAAGVNQYNNSGQTAVAWNFRRAPGFFDIVAYEWNGVATRNVEHNLGVAPEMYIVKRRNSATNWYVRHKDFFGTNGSIVLNSTAAKANTGLFTTSGTTATTFPVANDSTVNASGGTYIAYLFATLPGVSKVGSYTGNGSSQTIDCGFTSGARFILIKRTDNTGDWYVWDTARGIVSGNDPHLSLNTTTADVTTDDTIDPDSSGFIVNEVAATNVNVSSASYIFLAIA